MTRQSVVRRSSQLARPDVELVARWTVDGVHHDYEISGADLRRDADWTRRVLATYRPAPGSHVVKVSNGWDACWTIPLDDALHALRLVVSNVEAWTWDVRRLGAYLRRLSPVLVIGLGEDVLGAIESLGDPGRVLAGVDHLLVRPDAVDAARAVGLAPRLAGRLGPGFGMECAEGSGLHVDPHEWTLEVSPADGLLVTSAPARHARIDRERTGLYASLDHSPCPCGLPGPRVRFAPPASGSPFDAH